MGLLAGVNPPLAVGVAVGIGFLAITFYNLTAGLCLFAFLAFLDTALPGEGTLTVAKLAGLLLVGSWFAVVTTAPDRRALFSHSSYLILIGSFVGWSAVSAGWAEEPATAVDAAIRYAPNAFLFLIVFAAVRDRKHLQWVIAAFILGALFSAAYGLAAPSAPDETGRLAGAIGGANETAAVLVAGLALAIAMAAAMRNRPALRLAAVAAAAGCGFGVLLTVSRGALLALALALVFGLIFAGRWRASAAALAVGLAAVAVVYFTALAPPDARARFEELSGGTGRTDIWTVGLRMVQDNPVLGVGAGNFEVVSSDYLLRPGLLERSDFVLDDPKVAHNIYLHVLAELGVVGFALFLVTLIFSLTCFLKAAHRFEARGDRQMEILARGLLVALSAILAEDFFASQQYSKQLWLMLALGPAVLAISRERPVEVPTGQVESRRSTLRSSARSSLGSISPVTSSTAP